jgi:hypothetical protein
MQHQMCNLTYMGSAREVEEEAEEEEVVRHGNAVPQLSPTLVGDRLPRASRSRAAPPVTSATTTSLGGGESRYINDEDVDTILVSDDPGDFSLIPIDKRAGGGRGASFARTGGI